MVHPAATLSAFDLFIDVFVVRVCACLFADSNLGIGTIGGGPVVGAAADTEPRRTPSPPPPPPRGWFFFCFFFSQT